MKLASLLIGIVGLSLLSGCACPPRSTSYAAPLETLASWQSHLCHDDAQGEWRCLSADLQRSMGGFQTYLAARRQLIEGDTTVAWLLGRADLGDYVVAQNTHTEARRAEVSLEAQGQRFDVDFVQETAARISLDDGRFLFAILERPLPQLVGQVLDDQRRVTRQWIELARPRLGADDIARISSVQLEHRWKISAFTGLQPLAEITP